MDNLVKLLAEEVMECYLPDGSYLDITKHGVVMEGHNNRYWNPLENWYDCMMLVEQMASEEFEIEISMGFANGQNMVDISSPDEILPGTHESGMDTKEVICKAIAKALGIEYE